MTEQEIRQQILQRFYSRLAADPAARAALRRIDKGKATLADTAALSDRAADLLGEVFGANVLDIPEDVREAVCEGLLREQYDSTMNTCDGVLEALDSAQGLHLTPQHPGFPLERVQQLASSLTDPTVKPETIQRRASKPVATVAKSFHDSYIRINAQTRQNLGIKCYLDRVAAPGCCAWCTGIAGRYVYGDHPADIFRRHDNCSCTVTFENGRERQDVWSKRTWDAKDPAEVERVASRPVRLTQQQAERLQEIMMNGLTMPENRSIIEDRRTGIILNTKLYHDEVVFRKITDERIEHIAPLNIDSLSPESNQKLTKGCKDILDYMRNETLGREGTIVFDMNMSEIDRYMSERVASSVPAKTYTESCIVLHNHPSDTLLSDSDLWRFYEHDEYKILGAIGHNGSTYFVEKTADYDAFGFWDYLEECKLDFPAQMSPVDRVKYVEEVMKGADKYGIRFHTSVYHESD